MLPRPRRPRATPAPRLHFTKAPGSTALALGGLLALSGCGRTEAAASAPAHLTVAVESERPAARVASLALESLAGPGAPRVRCAWEPEAASASEPLALALPSGRYGLLELTLEERDGELVRAQPLALSLDPTLELAPGEGRTLTIELSWPVEGEGPRARVVDPVAGGCLAGSLVAAEVPVEGARLLALPAGERDPAEAVASTVSDARGSFRLRGLPPGSYDLLAEHGSARAAALQVALAAGETRDLTLELSE